MILTDVELLRTPCQDVLPEEIDNLRQTLEAELQASADRGHPGIGLAAPQIGIFKRMAIVRVPGQDDTLNIDLVNLSGKDITGYKKALFRGEGCLSFPDQSKDTLRFQEILVENNAIKPHRFTAVGLAAVVIQHEIDHLDGKLLIDQ